MSDTSKACNCTTADVHDHRSCIPKPRAICNWLQVDEIYIEFIRERGLYDKIWQAFAVFLDVRSVGVQVLMYH